MERTKHMIETELSCVKKIIKRTKRLIKKYPDDNGLPIDLITFEHREEQLLRELDDCSE